MEVSLLAGQQMEHACQAGDYFTHARRSVPPSLMSGVWHLEIVSRGCLELSRPGDGGDEGGVASAVAFVAEGQHAVGREPGQCAFDLPPVTAEAFRGIDAAPALHLRGSSLRWMMCSRCRRSRSK